MSNIVKILAKEFLTHDVIHLTVEKPENLTFTPGQATDIALNKPGWETEWRTFTFTSQPEDDHIEFNIKTYPSHQGVTNELLYALPGDELIIGDVYGDIAYKGEGIFIAGGAGITPFVAILNHLDKKKAIGKSKLIFANKRAEDIIWKDHFTHLLGDRFINVLSDEDSAEYKHGFITADIIKEQIEGHRFFYLCGPPPMMDAVEKQLAGLGIAEENIIKEGF